MQSRIRSVSAPSPAPDTSHRCECTCGSSSGRSAQYGYDSPAARSTPKPTHTSTTSNSLFAPSLLATRHRSRARWYTRSTRLTSANRSTTGARAAAARVFHSAPMPCTTRSARSAVQLSTGRLASSSSIERDGQS
jgi:hypothetical protein